MRRWVWSLASLSELRIWCCCELWYSCSSDLTPSLGTFMCWGEDVGKKQKKKKKKKKAVGQNKKSRREETSLFLPSCPPGPYKSQIQFFKIFLLKYSWFTIAKWTRHSYIYMQYIYIFFFSYYLLSCSILRDWIEFPVLCSRPLLLIHSKRNSLPLLPPNSPSITLPHPTPRQPQVSMSLHLFTSLFWSEITDWDVPIVTQWVKDPTLSLWGCRFNPWPHSVS